MFMGKNWKTARRNNSRTYDTDRYELFYHYLGEDCGFERTVWPTRVFAGPEEFNRSHVDLVVDPGKNRSESVTETDKLHNFRKNLTQEKAQFLP